MPEVNFSIVKGKVLSRHHSNYESRGHSVENLVRQACHHFSLSCDSSFSVYTGDIPTGRYSFSTIEKRYGDTFPCFLFDGWPECGVDNYQKMCRSFSLTTPMTNKIGFIGAKTSVVRRVLFDKFGQSPFIEVRENIWNRANPSKLYLGTPSYLTFQQQVDRYKYLIDVEGAGWSARAKILLRSPRITFLVERPYEEYYYQFLVPWKHYVPVKRDLSDLEENYHLIEGNSLLQRRILEEAKDFGEKYLEEIPVLARIREIIEENQK